MTSFHAAVDSVGFPAFVAGLLKGVYDANLGIQQMDLGSHGFTQMGQIPGPFQTGDVAVSGAAISVYVSGSWIGRAILRPPYRIYRYRQLRRR